MQCDGKRSNTEKKKKKVKRTIENLFKRGVIDNHMRKYSLPNGTCTGNVQANLKLHKKNHPIRTIINGRNHPRAKSRKLLKMNFQKTMLCLALM